MQPYRQKKAKNIHLTSFLLEKCCIKENTDDHPGMLRWVHFQYLALAEVTLWSVPCTSPPEQQDKTKLCNIC